MAQYQPEEVIRIFDKDWSNRDAALKKISKSKTVLGKYYRAALKGELQSWRKTNEGKFALILLYDQIPRLIFNDKKAYDTDELAREITADLAKKSGYKKLLSWQIMFAFFPYHHSENLKHQKITNRIFRDLYKKDPATFGLFYRSSNEYVKIISMFRRFPHRNNVLGRKSTKKEKNFLEKSEYGKT